MPLKRTLKSGVQTASRRLPPGLAGMEALVLSSMVNGSFPAHGVGAVIFIVIPIAVAPLVLRVLDRDLQTALRARPRRDCRPPSVQFLGKQDLHAI